MRCFARRLALLLGVALTSTVATAHPGSGIVVDRDGRIYFIDTGAGVWSIDMQGRIARHGGQAFHWLAIDPRGEFSASEMPRDVGAGLPVLGREPTLILSSDFPIAVGSDGALYYPRPVADRVQILRLHPGKCPEVFASLPPVLEIDASGKERAVGWIQGLAAAPDGSLYYSERDTVRRITQDGKVSVVAKGVKVPGRVCLSAAEDDRAGPGLRGLDVRGDGTVFVAASACGALLRIAPDGEVSVALRADAAWTPTGVVVAGEDVLVLEYWYVKSEPREAWLPRVRKLSHDGKVTVLATVRRP